MSDTSSAFQTIGSSSSNSVLLTFLIADIRGYSRFTVEQGDEAAALLASNFAEVCESVVGTHDGQVVELRGDEALCCFSSARGALRATLALLEAFSQAVAADPFLPLHVGIGLDAGEAIRVKNGYRGGALNLAARLCSIAGSGEAFASQTVIDLARKMDDISFIDRGDVNLKGISAPVRVIQVAAIGVLPTNLPPLLPTLDIRPTNLPDESTPFIGRLHEICAITELLQQPQTRLVTLLGPGGTGKTRLALQVAGIMLPDFRDGVFFVNLAPISDPVLVPSAIASAVGIREEVSKSLVDSLTDHLRSKHLLLVLDNCEHLTSVSQTAAPMLVECRELHILATSRIPLHLAREHEYPVPTLAVPDREKLAHPEEISQYEAVALFVERVRAVKPAFEITHENADAVVEICKRLDGLPLAIELAAARVRLFPPQALLHRLDQRLKILVGGASDLPTRQQTLRAAIDWSYSLLEQSERTLFSRLSVFAGGFTIDAAEAICGHDSEVLDGLTSLVEKSLVQQQEGKTGEPRFKMLETIREYATEKLVEHEQTEALRKNHARYFLHLPEEIGVDDPGDWGPGQPEGLKRLETELDNLRTALDWTQTHDENDLALRSLSSLFWLWEVRGLFDEGQRWAEALLAQRGAADFQIQARAVWVTGVMTARAGKFETARKYFEESLALFREIGDRRGTSWALLWLGNVAARFGDLDQAVAFQEAGREIAWQDGEQWIVAIAANNLGGHAQNRGDLKLAQTLHEEALAVFRAVEHESYASRALYALASLALEQGQLDRARMLLVDGFQVAQRVEDRPTLIACLVASAELAVHEGDGVRSAWLLGAAEAANAPTGAPWNPGTVADTTRAQMSKTAWQTAWKAGQAMSLESAVTAAATYIAGTTTADQ